MRTLLRGRVLGCSLQNWVATAVVFVSTAAWAQDTELMGDPIVQELLASSPGLQIILLLFKEVGLPGVVSWLAHRALKLIETGKAIRIDLRSNDGDPVSTNLEL